MWITLGSSCFGFSVLPGPVYVSFPGLGSFSSKNFSVIFFFPFPFQTPIMWMLVYLRLSQSSLNVSSFKKILFVVVLIQWLLLSSSWCRKADPFQGPKLGSCLTLGNKLSEETHVLTKQEILLGKGARVESSRVREPRRTALPRVGGGLLVPYPLPGPPVVK